MTQAAKAFGYNYISEAEMKARKDVLDDAISATDAAVAEGIFPGCGAHLYLPSKISVPLDAMSHREAVAAGGSRESLSTTSFGFANSLLPALTDADFRGAIPSG